MIVGFKRTIERGPFNRKGVAAVVVTTMELHSTKGWKTGKRKRGTTTGRGVPRFSEVFMRNPNHPPRDRRCDGIEITEKMLMRHAWYRRKKKWDAFRASLPEENRLS
jgi:hypothetical protein